MNTPAAVLRRIAALFDWEPERKAILSWMQINAAVLFVKEGENSNKFHKDPALHWIPPGRIKMAILYLGELTMIVDKATLVHIQITLMKTSGRSVPPLKSPQFVTAQNLMAATRLMIGEPPDKFIDTFLHLCRYPFKENLEPLIALEPDFEEQSQRLCDLQSIRNIRVDGGPIARQEAMIRRLTQCKNPYPYSDYHGKQDPRHEEARQCGLQPNSMRYFFEDAVALSFQCPPVKSSFGLMPFPEDAILEEVRFLWPQWARNTQPPAWLHPRTSQQVHQDHWIQWKNRNHWDIEQESMWIEVDILDLPPYWLSSPQFTPDRDEELWHGIGRKLNPVALKQKIQSTRPYGTPRAPLVEDGFPLGEEPDDPDQEYIPTRGTVLIGWNEAGAVLWPIVRRLIASVVSGHMAQQKITDEMNRAYRMAQAKAVASKGPRPALPSQPPYLKAMAVNVTSPIRKQLRRRMEAKWPTKLQTHVGGACHPQANRVWANYKGDKSTVEAILPLLPPCMALKFKSSYNWTDPIRLEFACFGIAAGMQAPEIEDLIEQAGKKYPVGHLMKKFGKWGCSNKMVETAMNQGNAGCPFMSTNGDTATFDALLMERGSQVQDKDMRLVAIHGRKGKSGPFEEPRVRCSCLLRQGPKDEWKVSSPVDYLERAIALKTGTL